MEIRDWLTTTQSILTRGKCQQINHKGDTNWERGKYTLCSRMHVHHHGSISPIPTYQSQVFISRGETPSSEA